jgi:hypothetical protein
MTRTTTTTSLFLLFALCVLPFLLTNALGSVHSIAKDSTYEKVGKFIVHPKASETVGHLHRKLTMNHKGKDFSSSVQALIDRVLLRVGASFEFKPVLEMIDYEMIDGQAFDVFEIDSKDNQVVFRGSSGVALSTAFGHYLRYHTNSDFHWEDGGGYSFSSFPSSSAGLPVPGEKERVVFLSKWRYYQNTCTASYSFAWKTWVKLFCLFFFFSNNCLLFLAIVLFSLFPLSRLNTKLILIGWL